jgi:HEAT repeat protein
VVVEGANDLSWRVREMSAKVVAKRHLDDAHDSMTVLLDDDVARVRAAAERALIRLVESES